MKSEQLTRLYRQQLQDFELAQKNYTNLEQVIYREIPFRNFPIRLQYNPSRILSTNAKIDAQTLATRKCFLCPDYRPEQQKGIPYGKDYHIFVNPYPIFPCHFTVPSNWHEPQCITGHFSTMLDLAIDFPEYIIFYNGPDCGASAPDHFHFQMAPRGSMPLETDICCEELCQKVVERDFFSISMLQNYLRKVIVLQASDAHLVSVLFQQVLALIGQVTPYEKEPMINLLCWFDNCQWQVCLFPRQTRRPWQFYAEGEEKILFSPGCVDMAGLIIAPRKEDFEKYSADLLTDLFQQVTISAEKEERIKIQLQKITV